MLFRLKIRRNFVVDEVRQNAAMLADLMVDEPVLNVIENRVQRTEEVSLLCAFLQRFREVDDIYCLDNRNKIVQNPALIQRIRRVVQIEGFVVDVVISRMGTDNYLNVLEIISPLREEPFHLKCCQHRTDTRCVGQIIERTLHTLKLVKFIQVMDAECTEQHLDFNVI